MKRHGSALLVVMAVMTGLSSLLTCWWQAVGWAGDLVLIRQQALTQFYATEMVRAAAVAWLKRSFDQVTTDLAKTKQPLTMDGGTVNLGPRSVGQCTVVIDRLPNDDQTMVVRVMVTVVVDGHQVMCHRCLVEQAAVAGAPRFVVHHVAFR
jgi:hypothetical protein